MILYSFQQPFEVYVELSALICMHFHSITSRNEVMGLVGGLYHENVSKCLQVCKYQPCQTVQQSRIDCEMCPGKLFIIYLYTVEV